MAPAMLFFSSSRRYLLALPSYSSHSRRFLASRTSSPAASDDDLEAARTWLNRFDADTIPQNIGELTFSRSSGPGGQNVNKVNSKATLRVPVDSLLQSLPRLIHGPIRSCRYYAAKSDSLIIQADDSRKQTDNAHSCHARLHALITALVRDSIPGETSAEQKARVKSLDKAANETRLKTKKAHSNKKSARKSSGRPDY